jgi:MGT family glycosyltransferase
VLGLQNSRLEQINAVRVRAGLTPVDSAEACWAAAGAVLIASTPILDDAPPEGIPGLHYVGPIFEPDDPTRSVAVPAAAESADPLVLVGLSSSYLEGQQELLGRVIEALRGLPVQALATAGPEVEADLLPTAANVGMHPWLPHNQVLPHAALMITHAGHSSIVRALTYGVPMLCIPLGRDQPFNAGRVEAIGAGLALPTDAEPAVIADAVQTLVRDSCYREAARRAADAIAAAGSGAANGADLVEAIAVRR